MSSEENRASQLAKNLKPIRVSSDKPFADSDGFRARCKGFSGTAVKNTSTNIDFEIVEERWINGVAILLKNHMWGDRLHFEIVDKNNVLGYGAGTVLDRFGEDWNVDPENMKQEPVVLDYPARIYTGLFIRIVYISTGTENDVDVKLNTLLHKKDV